MDEAGNTIEVVCVPTNNQFDVLSDNQDEIVVKGKKLKTNTSETKRIRIPPITVFEQTREKITELLEAIQVKNYSVQLLRRAIHVFCESADDFKKVRAKLSEVTAQYYTHELEEDRSYKVVLKGLHQMDTKELKNILQNLKLEVVDVRPINPKNPRRNNDVVYVIGLKRGSIKFKDLLAHKTVYHTVVQWDHYKPRGGVVQCTKCQRPGHGAKNCNMPPRCCVCGENHETNSCNKTKSQLPGTSTSQNGKTVELKTPAKCCNCGEAGHFASDPNCKRRKQYIQSRRLKADAGRINRKSHISIQKTSEAPLMYTSHGPTYADVTRLQPGLYQNNFNSPSGNFGPSGSLGPSGIHPNKFNSFVEPSHSVKFDEQPFSYEEITSLTFEIVSSLKNVQHLPRSEAFKAVMNVAFKYLYRNDAK